jgi:hypothetical protein
MYVIHHGAQFRLAKLRNHVIIWTEAGFCVRGVYCNVIQNKDLEPSASGSQRQCRSILVL